MTSSRMLRGMAGLGRLLVVSLLLLAVPAAEAGKYSSGRSFSRSSFSGGGSHSYSSGSSGSSKSYSSGSSHSYGSGSNPGSGYTAGKSYGAGSDRSSSSGYSSAKPKSSGMNLDAGASRAAKEQASKNDFSSYKRSQGGTPAGGAGGGVPPVIPRSSSGSSPGYAGNGNGSSTTYHHTTVYVDHTIYSTRPYRFRTYYAPYYSRPVIIYNDNYNSFFWWWLLDRSIEDQALWTYNHRATMDAARYQALLNSNVELENRVHQLENRQVAPDPNYVPPGLDPDLMYNDQTIKRAYAAQPSRGGQIGFWFFTVPLAICVVWFFGWMIFFKRWQPATA